MEDDLQRSVQEKSNLMFDVKRLTHEKENLENQLQKL